MSELIPNNEDDDDIEEINLFEDEPSERERKDQFQNQLLTDKQPLNTFDSKREPVWKWIGEPLENVKETKELKVLVLTWNL